MDPVETGRRVKAAVAYGNLDRKQAAGILGISVETLNRIYRGLSEPPARLLPDLARKCELPPAFFTVDFAATGDGSDLGARVLNLETQTASLVRSVDRAYERFNRLDERLRLWWKLKRWLARRKSSREAKKHRAPRLALADGSLDKRTARSLQRVLIHFRSSPRFPAQSTSMERLGVPSPATQRPAHSRYMHAPCTQQPRSCALAPPPRTCC
jgi:transcriptional regulator with XRE-family HTH domain